MKSHIKTSSRWSGILINIALLFFVVQQFTVNSRLLAHLNIDSRTAMSTFDFTNFQSDNILAMLNSVAYSIITAIILKMSKNKGLSLVLIFWFSIMEGALVLIYYSVFTNFQKIGAIFYAIYTFSIVMAIGLYQLQIVNKDSPENHDDKITILRKQLYNRKKNLKYNGVSSANDKIVKELNASIDKLLSGQ